MSEAAIITSLDHRQKRLMLHRRPVGGEEISLRGDKALAIRLINSMPMARPPSDPTGYGSQCF